MQPSQMLNPSGLVTGSVIPQPNESVRQNVKQPIQPSSAHLINPQPSTPTVVAARTPRPIAPKPPRPIAPKPGNLNPMVAVPVASMPITYTIRPEVESVLSAGAASAAQGVAVAGPPRQHFPQQPPQQAPPNTTYVKPSEGPKSKCRKFFVNLLELSSKEGPSVEPKVRTLVQELIDGLVEPDQFCARIERLLQASPQPSLVGFLTKGVPQLRQALANKEVSIEGIRPPAPPAAFPGRFPPAQAPVEVAATTSQTQQQEPAPNPAPEPAPEPARKPGSAITVLENVAVHSKVKVSRRKGVAASKAPQPRTGPIYITPEKGLIKGLDKNTAQPFVTQQYSDDKMAGDDDINDVAAMGGVNLAEETQRILGSTEMIGTQIRSCKDESLVPPSAMQACVKALVAKRAMEEAAPEVASLVSHALQERLKTVVERLAVVAQQRIDAIKEEQRQREANQTALQAIGPFKKPRLDAPSTSASASASASTSAELSGRGQMELCPRMKRITRRDLLAFLESDEATARSDLYKAYLK